MKKTATILPFNTGYNLDYEARRKKYAVYNTLPTRTQSHFAEECNIRNILRKYDRDGVITHIHNREPKYGDFSELPDYQQTMQRLQIARDEFMNIPSQIREKFHNDPGKFFEFVTDPKNHQELIDMGLIKEKPKQTEEKPQEEVSVPPVETESQSSEEPPSSS